MVLWAVLAPLGASCKWDCIVDLEVSRFEVEPRTAFQVEPPKNLFMFRFGSGSELVRGHFHKKKWLREVGQQPQGLANLRLVISWKKYACGKLVSSNRACQIHGGPFARQTKASSKLVSSNRTCQVHVAIFTQQKTPEASWLAA